ncbi:MAG: hypothetical protein K2J47_05380 [Ruminococcus sp.]|nr:hypothetical protein [Ruminococcus sp.]MDE6788737.1 hypothetical protein [Ruminococcus sp.]
MKKLISIFSAITICTSLSSCGQSLTEEENKILEALVNGKYSYEEYGDIISCSNIYSYDDENDEQYPFILLDVSNKVDSYCYIDFADDDEDVCVLVVEGDSQGTIFTYSESAIASAYHLLNSDYDLFIKMFPSAVENIDNLNEIIPNRFTELGYYLFYVPDDSTINTRIISKNLTSENKERITEESTSKQKRGKI